MKLSTGKIAFPVEFDNGDKQAIYFNPSDPDLIVRMKNLQSKIWQRIDGLDDLALSNEGKPIEESQIDAFEQMQNILKDELDFAFSGSVSEVVFKHCSPFALINGEYFVVQFIEAVMPEIEKHINNAKNEAEKRMAKHINKYK